MPRNSVNSRPVTRINFLPLAVSLFMAAMVSADTFPSWAMVPSKSVARARKRVDLWSGIKGSKGRK